MNFSLPFIRWWQRLPRQCLSQWSWPDNRLEAALAERNHPNIATLHGLEESGSIHALVMELVEGPTMAERLAAAAPYPSARHSRESLPSAKAGGGGNPWVPAPAATTAATQAGMILRLTTVHENARSALECGGLTPP